MTEKEVATEAFYTVLAEKKEERQRALYDLLVSKGDKFTYQPQVYAELRHYYPPLTSDSFHDNSARLWMSADISEINRSREYEKIIISTPKGIKIANKEEARKMLSARYAAAKREIHDLTVMIRKFELDGQSDADGEIRATFIGDMI